jgi:hypothetical protein
LGCTGIVALNKRELILTNNAKDNKQAEIKPLNLLHQHEFILLDRIFLLWLSKVNDKFPKVNQLNTLKFDCKSKLAQSIALRKQKQKQKQKQEVFVIATQILAYCIRNDYKNLNVNNFLGQWEYKFSNLNTTSNDSINNQPVFLGIKILIYGLFCISLIVKSNERLLNKTVF